MTSLPTQQSMASNLTAPSMPSGARPSIGAAPFNDNGSGDAEAYPSTGDLNPTPLPDYDPNDPHSAPPGPAPSVDELFRRHFDHYPHLLGSVSTEEEVAARVRQIWDNDLTEAQKSAWYSIHDELQRRWEERQSLLKWGRITDSARRGGSNLGSSSHNINAEMGGDSDKGDGDTVMMGVEDDEEGR